MKKILYIYNSLASLKHFIFIFVKLVIRFTLTTMYGACDPVILQLYQLM